MKKHTALLFALLLLGCSTTPVATPSPSPQIAIERSAESEDKLLTGRKFFFNEKQATQAAPAVMVEKLRAQIRSRMKTLGYEEASAPRKAHTSILLYSDLVNEKNARFNVTLHRHYFGKRPVTYGYVTFTAPQPTWNGLEDALLALTDEEFKSMLGPAPSADLPMKGDPACFPRFGYEYSGDRVTVVYPGSAAAAAGVNVGDIIEAVDSQPLSEAIDNEEMYESNAKVPLKIKRADKTIRTTVQAKMACE